MKERSARLETIRRLIKTGLIESQEILLKRLETEGYAVTQATLSRDLKLLRVGKISAANGYSYTLPDEDDRQKTGKFPGHDFLRGYVSINWSGNLAVIKTHSGHSDAVALALDTLNLDEIMGTISGRDDTVFVALKEGVSGKDFFARLKEKIPEIMPVNSPSTA
ncbi:MAG: ArgR family transcriptional regulator [Treponema sp.]|jgi:transcriptional regulator of arginine metabolism|nr:ArgR family transcriptional regulator [Treponema sp.]